MQYHIAHIEYKHYLCGIKLIIKFENMKIKDEKVSDLGAMKALETGQSIAFDIKKISCIRTNASLINATRGEQSLTTKIDRKAGTITVSRIA